MSDEPEEDAPASPAASPPDGRDDASANEAAQEPGGPGPALPKIVKQVLTVLLVLSGAASLAIEFPDERVFEFDHSVILRIVAATVLVFLIIVRVSISEKPAAAEDATAFPYTDKPLNRVFRAVLAAAKLIGLGQSRRREHPTHTELYSPDDFLVSLVEAEMAVEAQFSRNDLLRLLGFLTAPQLFVRRLTQAVTFTSTHYVETLTRSIAVGAEDGFLLLPILRPRKGQIVNQLSVSVNGQRASTLIHFETQGVVVFLIRALCYQALGHDIDRRNPKLIGDILITCCSSNLPEPDKLTSLIADIKGASRSTDDGPSHLRSLTSLVELLAQHYLVISVSRTQPEETRLRLVVSVTRPRRDTFGTFTRRIRNSLGLIPRSMLILIPYASEARSYHLQASVPEGAYIFRASPQLVTIPSTDSPAIDWEYSERQAKIATGLTLSDTIGGNVAHVYGRDISRGSGARGQAFYLEFREVPPGMLASIGPVSLFMLILVWGVAHFYNLTFPLSGYINTTSLPSSGASSVPTIILGLPALFSSVLLSRLSQRTAQASSLVTLVLLAWLMVNAAMAVSLAALSSSQRIPSLLHVSDAFSVRHVGWGLLMSSTALHFSYTSYLYFARLRRYWDRLSISQYRSPQEEA